VKSIDTENIIFVDLIEELNRLGLSPQEVAINYIYNESHKNASSLKVLADYIYRTLKSRRIIPD